MNDIYTDTVLLVLEHIESGTFKGDSKLATYFYRIFYFKSVDFIRKNASNKIDYTNDLPDQCDDSQNISKLIEVTEEVKQIMKILDSMCSPCRELIMDWAYWGFKVDEIGARIGETDPVKFSKIKYNCIDKFKKLWNEKVSRM